MDLIAVGLQDPEAVVIGARQLAQHERVKPIGLPSRGAKAIAGGRDLVGVQGQDPQSCVEQPLDQQPIGPLNRDQLHLQAHQRAAQGPQTLLLAFGRRYEQIGAPFQWKFTREDLHKLLAKTDARPTALAPEPSSPIRARTSEPDHLAG